MWSLKTKNLLTRTNFPLFFVISIAVILRILAINRGVWEDENISLETIAENPLKNPLYANVTTNLPLFFYFMKIWSLLFDYRTQIYAFRLIPVLFSIGLLILGYRFIKEHLGEVTAVIFGLIFATSPIQVYYAQELRPYMLTQLLVTINLIAVYTFIKTERINSYFLFLITSLLLTLSHYSAYFYLYSLFTVLVFFAVKTDAYAKRKLLCAFIIFNFIVVAFSTYFIFKELSRFQTFQNSINELVIGKPTRIADFRELGQQFFDEGVVRIKEVTVFYYYFGQFYYLVEPAVQFVFKKLILFLLILFPFLYVLEPNKDKDFTLHALMVGIICILTSYFAEKVGFYPFGGRQILPFSILFYIPVAFSLGYLCKRTATMALLLFIILVSLFINIHAFDPRMSQALGIEKAYEKIESDYQGEEIYFQAEKKGSIETFFANPKFKKQDIRKLGCQTTANERFFVILIDAQIKNPCFAELSKDFVVLNNEKFDRTFVKTYVRRF